MAADPIHVEAEDEVPAIIERLRRSSADEVHLVLPARARFGQSRFNFQLLKQYSTRLGKRVAIVSPDPTVQRLAEESGFGAFRVVEGTGLPPGGPQGQPRVVPGGGRAPGGPGQGQHPGPGDRVPNWPAPAGWRPGQPGVPGAGGRPGPGGPLPGAGPGRPGPGPRDGGPASSLTSRLGSIAKVGRQGDAAVAIPGLARIRIGAPRRLPARIRTQIDQARTAAYIGGALALTALLIALAYFVPSAQVTLVAQATPFSTNVDVLAQPNKAPIRVRAVKVDRIASAGAPATGQKVTPGNLATGTFVYVNGCPFALDIPNGQRLLGPGGVQFAQLGDVQVGPGGTAGGSIKAVQPGQNANVGAGQITGIAANQYSCLVGSNPDATQGGTDDQKQTVIQSSDLQGVRAQLELSLRQQILDDLGKGVQKGEKLVPQPTVLVEDYNTTHQVDDAAPNFTATLHLVVEGDYYMASDLNAAAAAVLKSKVPAGQQLTSDQITPNVQVAGSAGGHLEFTGQVSGFIAPQLDLDHVRGELVGRSAGDAHNVLSSLPVRQVEIKQSPFPLPIMPFSASRIHVAYRSTDPAAVASGSG